MIVAYRIILTLMPKEKEIRRASRIAALRAHKKIIP
jgi:hypothetical protein